MERLLALSNPLITIEQLSSSSSQLDGVPSELESSVRLAGAKLTQAAGILLQLPQQVVAQAIVIFTRFYAGPEGGSLLLNAAQDVSAASLYMMAKLSAYPQSPRSILNVYAYLLSDQSLFTDPKVLSVPTRKPDPESYYLSEGAVMAARAVLYQTEATILRTISFVTQAIVPHHLALTFLQTIGVLQPSPTDSSRALAARTIAHLNTALFSPQLVYLTHQPTALAVASIYLSAKEVGVKLPTTEWWEVFDVDREELGFLVLALGSCGVWIKEEGKQWATSQCPLTVEGVEMAMKIV